MAYQIKYTPDAEADIKWLERIEQVDVQHSVPIYLKDQPGEPTRRRKQMHPNPLGIPWGLRLDELRVYYDFDQAAQIVRVLRVGRKIRNRVFIRGVEMDMREQP